MQIAIVGSGYVGLVSGACFAEFGFKVVNVDINAEKIANLKQGKIPIYEPGLESLVREGLKRERLVFSTDLVEAVANSQVVMIAVGTPSSKKNNNDTEEGEADLSYVYGAVEKIAAAIKSYTVIVTKSTVPVGTCRKVAEFIEKLRPDLKMGIDFDVASNPEFLREGSAISDFLRPDRVIIGTDSQRARNVLANLYRPLYLIEIPILFTNIETAELTKYAANGFLAIKIGFINQMADLCEKVGADVQELAKGMGLDNRIGSKFLNAGPGYGGSCFPKDTVALSKTAKDYNVSLTLIDSVIKSNNSRKREMAQRIIDLLSKRGDLQTQSVAVLGITFKPNTDDLRDAASLVIIPELIKTGLKVNVYDPLYFLNSDHLHNKEEIGDEFWSAVRWFQSSYQAMEGADAVVILTEWNEFRALDLEKVKKCLRGSPHHLPLLIDFRNIYKPLEIRDIDYHSLGRSKKASNHPTQ